MTDLAQLSDDELLASLPRGVRSNNPLNLKGADGQFRTFGSPDEGLAAADQNLEAYGTKHGINTVSGVVSRWAPASDGNDPGAYATHVSSRLGIKPDQQIDLADPGTRQQLLSAMSEFENGGKVLPAADLGGVSDDELLASLGDQAKPKSPGSGVGDAVFIAKPDTAMRPGSGFVDAKTGENLSEAQSATYADLAKRGGLDRNAMPGSQKFPLAQRDPSDLPKPGDWYVPVKGGAPQQVPADPWADTVKHAVAAVAVPQLERAMPEDPRYSAMTRATQSGLALGGRNELVAGVKSLPALFEGGVPLLKDRFGAELRAQDQKSAQSRRDFPLVYDTAATGGALAGGAAIPEVKAAGLARKLALGAGLGGAGGFLSTDGSLGDRGKGAALGAVGGAALPLVIPKIAGGLADMTGIPMRRAGATKPELRAAEAASRALTRDKTLPATLQTGAMPLHAGGDNLAALAEVIAQSPGEGQSIIRTAIRDQQAGTPGRVKGEIAKTFGGEGDYFDKLDELRDARRAEASSVMNTLGVHEVALDPNSVSALRSDLARGAIKEQAQNALASADPEVRAAGARLSRLHEDLLDQPGAQTITVRDAQNISKTLLDAADGAYSSGNGARGKALKDLGRAVRDNAATPEQGGFAEYGDWLKKYGEDSTGIDALEMGRNVFSSSLDMSAERLRKTFSKWGQAAQDNYRKGVGEAVLDAVRRKGGVAEARQLLKNEEFADRVRVAVPDHMSFKDFMASMEQEVAMADRNNRIAGGSPTYARQAARADLEAQASHPLDMAAEAIDTSLSPVRLGGKALKVALKAIPRKDRSVIGDPVANATLAGALKDPDQMTRLLNMLESYKGRRGVPLRQIPARLGGQIGAALAEPSGTMP